MRMFVAAAAVALSAGNALAQEAPVAISDVSVTVELANVEANALERWPQIGQDLEEAIRTAATPYLANEGVSVAVVLNEVSLGGVPELDGEGAFNRLSGWIYLRDEVGAPPVESREIVFEANEFVPGGTADLLIFPGRPEFYNALVNVFAMRVVEEVDALR